jgi:hypothetical protein
MRKIICLGFALVSLSATAFPAARHIAFERNDAVYIANLNGTGERKIADGIFPAISPDGTRIAFNTVEKTSDTTYVRHIAVVEVATGKVNVLRMSRATIHITQAGRLTGNRSFSPRARRKPGISPLLIRTGRIFTCSSPAFKMK